MSQVSGPLFFEPLIRVLPWGGRKLGSFLNKALPSDQPCGESWEIVDLKEAQSIIQAGALAGQSLGPLVRKYPSQVLGGAKLLQGRFPVLFKFIDAAKTLSVQVHPDKQAAADLGHGARPKTEAWYVLDAEPGAKLYLGLKEGVGKSDLEAALRDGSVAELLMEVDARPGEFYFIPAGLLHAIGGGILLAEIQQSSDTTYRVFDWNRMGLDGKPRQLHVPQALASIDFDLRGQVAADLPASGRHGLRCESFSFEKLQLQKDDEVDLGGGSPCILACIDGQGTVGGAGDEAATLPLGRSCLLPACCPAVLSSESGGDFLLIEV